MMWFGDAMHAGWGIAGTVMMSAFWLGLLGLIWVTVARLTGRDAHREDRPEDILKRRLARGEIDLDEYQRLREQLR